MDLFSNTDTQNLLPYDGALTYYGQIMSLSQANNFLSHLLAEVPWKNDEVVIYGKHIVTKRQIAWYADELATYTYSNTEKMALPWSPTLLSLKSMVEDITAKSFNSCLLNLYHNGEEGMSWHSDDEKKLGKNTAIASLSFGAERKFVFKHKKTKERVELLLPNGSLLLMHGETQSHWLHSLPVSKKVKLPRVNLTFRTIISATT